MQREDIIEILGSITFLSFLMALVFLIFVF